MVSNEVLLDRLARMVLALRRGDVMSFGGDEATTELTVTVPRGADRPQFAIRCHVRKRDGSMFNDVWHGCDWTIDNLYAEAALLTEADLAQLPAAEDVHRDPVAAAIAQLNVSSPVTTCGHRLMLRPRESARDDLPSLEIADVRSDGAISSLRSGIDWADDYVHP